MSTTDCHHYRRANFATRLPAGHLYSPSHAWLCRAPESPGRLWRVGLTRFALRMLGELVELQIHPPPGEAVELGDVLGTVEGFKALSDVYCVGQGTFVGGNPAVQADLDLIARDPYEAGWIYAIEGEPDARSLDVEGYRQLLDDIIDRMMARQKLEEEAP